MAATDATPTPTLVAAPRAVLLDIEGTTTSISFVKDTLFPYAVNNVEKFLTSSWEGESVQAAVEGMRQQSIKDVEEKIEGAILIPDKEASKEDQIVAVSKSLKWLISIDNKGTHMKDLSGFIWQNGYEAGEIKGHLYDDVKPAIEKWKDSGIKVYIYSSGSVHAQKLLMKYSTAGDLEPLLDGYFDTNIGHKREVLSYKNILEKVQCASEDTLFLTDIVEEGNAAKEAGINIILLSREGNAPLSKEINEKYTVVETFADANFPSLKRKSCAAEEEDTRPAKITKSELNGNVAANGDQVEEASVTPASVVEEKMDVDEEVKVSDPKPIAEPEVSPPSEPEKLETNGKAESPKQIETDIEKVEAIEDESVTVDVKKVAESNEVNISEADIKTSELEKTEGTSKTSDEQMETDVSEVISEHKGAVSEDTDVEKTDIMMYEVVAEKKEYEAEAILEPEDAVEENISEETTVKEVSEAPVSNGNEAETSGEETPEAKVVEIENNDEKTDEKIDDDKLIELIQEKTVELDKQCDEIISKTNNVIVVTKDFINKRNEEKEDDIESETATETETAIEEKAAVEEAVNDDAPKEAVPESVVEEKAAVLETSQDEPEDSPKENATEAPVENLESKNGDISKEVNGDEAQNGHATNGKEAELNGKSGDHEASENGTNGTTESAEPITDAEIKVKKIATEETPPETAAEQAVET